MEECKGRREGGIQGERGNEGRGETERGGRGLGGKEGGI